MPEEVREERVRYLEETVRRDAATALYMPLAERWREQGRVEEAVRLCEERKNRPGHGVGDRIVLGRCYLADGRLHEARGEFEGALALDRENVVALKALAGILCHEGAHVRAADLYLAVCRIDPGDLESQTALHQITSGEFSEVRPPDIIVDSGDVAWQPVRLPREEEHLSTLGLGLRTIETFDILPPSGRSPDLMDFRDLSVDELEPSAPPARVSSSLGTAPAIEERSFDDLPAKPAAESPPAQEPGPVAGNKSAFQEWLGRLGGGR